MEKSGKSVVHVGVYLLGNILQRATTFLLVPLYVRAMTPSEYGLLTLSFSILSIALIFFSLGLEASVVRLYFDYNESRHELRKFLWNTFLLRLTISVLMVGAFFPIMILVWPFLGGAGAPVYWAIILISGCAVVQSITDFITAVYRARRQPVLFVSTKCLQSFLQIGLTLFLLPIFKNGAAGPLLAYLGSALFVALVGSAFYIRDVGSLSVDFTEAKKNISYGLPTVPQKIGNWMNSLSDRLILAKMVGLSVLGVYQLGYTAGSISAVIVTSVNAAYVPSYYKWMKTGVDPYVIAFFDFLIIYILGTITLVGVVFAPEIIYLLAAPSFADAGKVMPIILLSYFLYAQYTQFLKELHYRKMTMTASLNVFVPGILLIPVNIVLIPVFGMLAAAWTTFVAFALTLLGVIYFSRRIEKGVHPLKNLLAVNFLAFAVTLFSLWFPMVSGRVMFVKAAVLVICAISMGVLLLSPFKRQIESYIGKLRRHV